MNLLAKIKGNELITYPYSFKLLQDDNPQVMLYDFSKLTEANPFASLYYGSHPLTEWFNKTETALEHSLVEVTYSDMPVYDAATQKVVTDLNPTLTNGEWIIQRTVKELSAEEIYYNEITPPLHND